MEVPAPLNAPLDAPPQDGYIEPLPTLSDDEDEDEDDAEIEAPVVRIREGYEATPMTAARAASMFAAHATTSPKRKNWLGAFVDIAKGGRRTLETAKAVAAMVEIHKDFKRRKAEGGAPKEATDAYLLAMATAFRDMVMKNGGFQVKVGQMLSMNSAILCAIFPEVVAKTLHECCEGARALPLDDVMVAIENRDTGLGRRLHDVFLQIESKALAAASIAQVHRATLKACGSRVLVKVQHPGVKDSMAADVAILPALISLVDMLEPNHGLRPMMFMIEAMLRQEMDFRIEGANRERLAAVVDRSRRTERSQFANVVFPVVYWDYCCESVMVQEFAEGAVSLGSRAAVQALGVPYAVALRELSIFFAEGAFVHGYMHNDLHTGNAMVRPARGGEPRTRLERAAATPDVAAKALAALYVAALAVALSACYGGLWAPLRRQTRGTVLDWPLAAIAQLVQTALFSLVAAAVFFGRDPDQLSQVLKPAAGESVAERGARLLEAYPRAAALGEALLAKHAAAKAALELRAAELARVRFDLVIIDHGFHTHVSYETRLAWCKCWAAIGLCDEELLVEAAADFGLEGDDYKHLPMMLSLFPYPLWPGQETTIISRNGLEALWRENRYGTLGEWLKLLKSKDWGVMAFAEVLNKKMPREFHLMHRTSQQVGALFQIEYGMGWKSGLEFLRLMTRHALLGLRFRDRAAAVLPVPGELKTPDRAWFDREGPAVEARMERQFKWNVPSGLAGQIDESVLDLVFDGEAAKKLDGGVEGKPSLQAVS
ncbi:hypothetical protein SO694_00143052 [Aureococcus anophagefferens]|uniref:ABC1 atypical kinase-like domain-containing protein n=1 Tax=Aureococcus anophagefferens TaxID=44056 RepID=A0ABR1FPJ2_AURAN